MRGPIPSTWSGPLMSILRIVTGVLFLMHGTQKLLGWPPTDPPMALEMLSLPWIAGVLELSGGVLIILGLMTRPVAFLLAGEMAVAFFHVHFPMGPWPIVNHGEPAVLFCFIFLFFAAAGPGPWALDRPHAEPPPLR